MGGLVVTRAQWAEQIRTSWYDSFVAIFHTGELLLGAKAALPHGEWEAMIGSDLPFSPSTAQRLMKVARDPRFTNPAHVQLLPPHWGTLYELTKLSDADFQARLADGTIHPDMERSHLTAAVREANAAKRLTAIREAPLVIAGERFPVLYADPPWQYEHPPMGDSNRSVERHYDTLPVEEICAVEVWGRSVSEIAHEDAVLFLWATVPLLPEALAVMTAWGFVYKSHIIWDKEIPGTGYWARIRHELLLTGRRGDIPVPPESTRPVSVFASRRGEHSVKPEIVYDFIEVMYPDLPKLEMFARKRRGGLWVSWGNELPPEEEEGNPPAEAAE